ncbi:MAG: ATP-binding protein [Sarcina sp.]
MFIYLGIAILISIIVIMLIKNMQLKNKYDNIKCIIDTFDGILCFKDSEGKILECNSDFKEIFEGCGEIIGCNNDDFIKNNPQRTSEILQCQKSDDEVRKLKKEIRIKEDFYVKNEKCTFDVVKKPIFRNGKFEGIAIVGKNITDKLKMEKFKKIAAENERALTAIKNSKGIKLQLFANLSHEFKTPINVIQSAISTQKNFLENGDLSLEKSLKHTNYMEKNVNRLTRIVNNFITIAEFESAHIKCNLINADIIMIIEDIIASVEQSEIKKDLEIVFDTNTEELIMAIDIDMFEKVILNLISNAIKFAGSKKTLLIYVDENEDGVAIYAKDNGDGISENKKKYIFEKFIQGDMSSTRNSEGSGIGLTVAKAFIELHGGKLTLEKVTKGTCFKIFLKKFKIGENVVDLSKREEHYKQIIKVELSDI